MDLVIYRQKSFIAYDFIDYVCNVIRQLLLSSGIDFQAFNNYFSMNYDTDISAQSILVNASLNLTVKNYQQIAIISIDENVNYNNSQIRLIDLCKLLNYGNLDIQGTKVFSDTFDYVAHNIHQIYFNYIMEM